MNEIILIILWLVFIETSFLVVRSFRKGFNYSGQRRRIYVDTSSLMDGRILKVAKTGFLDGLLIIPHSVLNEMQLLADGKDTEKRARARFGLDVVNELERVVHNEVEILPDALDHTPVDNRLLQLAKENRGTILTTDYNLGMVAKTMDIDVLNVNDLAIELRSDYLPGERMRIKITALGSNPKQGVGYLPDGMMVVVDEAATLVGRFVEIEFVKFLQTNSGRMMFAKVATQTRPSGRFARGAGRKIKTRS